MKHSKPISLIILMILILTFGGCEKVSQTTNVVKKFISAINEKNFNNIMECLDPKYEKIYKAASQFSSLLSEGSIVKLDELLPNYSQLNNTSTLDFKFSNYNIVSEVITNDNSIVKVELTIDYTDLSGKNYSQKILTDFYLTKFSEGWRIIDINEDKNTNVESQDQRIINLEERMNDGKYGTKFEGSYKNATQCKGFAKKVFFDTFGIDLPANSTLNDYEFQDSSKIKIVGQLISNGNTISADQVKETFKKAKKGDVVQMCWYKGYMHTAIFMGFDEKGRLIFFDANRNLHNGISHDPISVETYAKYITGINRGCTIYTSVN